MSQAQSGVPWRPGWSPRSVRSERLALQVEGHVDDGPVFTAGVAAIEQGDPWQPGGLVVEKVLPPVCGDKRWNQDRGQPAVFGLGVDAVEIVEEGAGDGAVGRRDHDQGGELVKPVSAVATAAKVRRCRQNMAGGNIA